MGSWLELRGKLVLQILSSSLISQPALQQLLLRFNTSKTAGLGPRKSTGNQSAYQEVSKNNSTLLSHWLSDHTHLFACSMHSGSTAAWH